MTCDLVRKHPTMASSIKAMREGEGPVFSSRMQSIRRRATVGISEKGALEVVVALVDGAPLVLVAWRVKRLRRLLNVPSELRDC